MNQGTTTVIESALGSVASKATMYTGGGASVLAWYQSVDWLAVIGAVAAIAGFLFNFYFQYRKHKREELQAMLQMQRENDEAVIRMQRDQELHEIEIAKLKEEYHVE